MPVQYQQRRPPPVTPSAHAPPRLLSAPSRSGAVAAKVALDGNANALDAGLEALVAFLGKADEEYTQRRVV